MGVEYSSSSGYGFILGPKDDWETIGDLLGLEESYSYEIVEALCNKHGLNFVTAGDSYAGEVYFLIGDTFGVNEYRFIEIDPNDGDDESNMIDKIYDAMDAIQLDKPVGYYVGLHVY